MSISEQNAINIINVIGQIEGLFMANGKNIAYVPAGYLVMKSDYGLQGLNESDISAVMAEIRSRICTLALGQYRIQSYRLG